MKVVRKKAPSGKWLAVIVCTEEEAKTLINGQDALALDSKTTLTVERRKQMENIRACLIEAAYGRIT